MNDDLPDLLDELRGFVAALPYDIEHCVAFGSRVRGDHTRWSDFDVLLVSADFAGMAFEARIHAVMSHDAAWHSTCPLEIICLTPAELVGKLEYGGLVRGAWQQGRHALVGPVGAPRSSGPVPPPMEKQGG